MRALAYILLWAVLAAGCSLPAVRGTAWDNRDPSECLEPHPNGLWERQVSFCRSGKGFLFWAVWAY